MNERSASEILSVVAFKEALEKLEKYWKNANYAKIPDHRKVHYELNNVAVK